MGIIIDINIDTIYPVLNYKNSNMLKSLPVKHTHLYHIYYIQI